MRYDFEEWYNAYKSEPKPILSDLVIKSTQPPRPGLFYVIHQVKKSDEPYNQQIIGLAIGQSQVNPDSFNIIDICMLPIAHRVAFLKLYFKTYNKQITDNMDTCWESKTANLQKPINGFNMKWVQRLLKICKISQAIVKVKLSDCKNISITTFPQVHRLVTLCDTNHFVGINIKNIQDLNK